MRPARQIIEALQLAPHPEGGWYRETWVAPAQEGERSVATTILFLLEAGQRSHWHRVDATEIWLFHAGAPLVLSTAAGEQGEGERRSVLLGPDPLAGQVQQHVVNAFEWQAAEGPEQGWSLVACVVAPGFRFEGFEIAPPDWRPAEDA